MLIQTDNTTDTVDLSIEILLPTSSEYEDFPHSRAKPSEDDTVNHAFCCFNSSQNPSDIVVGHSDSSLRISAVSKA